MALQVVDAEYRNAERHSERLGIRGADEQRAGEAGPFGVANAGQLAHRLPPPRDDPAGERAKAVDVIAGGELGDDAAVGFVHGDLRVHSVRGQAAGGAVVERDARFVAGSLDTEDEHSIDFDTIQPPFEPRTGCRSSESKKTSRLKWPCGASSARSRRRVCLPNCERVSTTRSRPPKGSASSPRP